MGGLSEEELLAEGATALPDKEVASVLDLNADLNLGIEAAAPIDLAVAANANVAAPIDAAASANILSFGSESQALSDQGVIINQGIVADANATSVQDSGIDQTTGSAAPAAEAPAAAGTADGATAATVDAGSLLPDGTTAPVSGAVDGAVDGATGVLPDGTLPDGTLPDVGALPTDAAGALNGNLLNVNVNLDANAGITAPINGAVAANANVAAPIDAAVAANIGSIDSNAYAVSQQDAIITQNIEGEATASADQTSNIQQ